MLCGLLPATSGYLNVAGVDLSVSRTKAREKLGYVAQKFSLYGNLSVLENLRFFGGAYGLSGETLKKRINEVIDEFSLHGRENDAAESLPGGYKQRLSMAAALMHKPKILFLDEPTSGIDPLARRQFWRQITDLSAHGTTIIITTHFMEEAEYCDRIMIQDQGRLFAIGSPEGIRDELGLKHAPMNEVFITIVENGRNEEHK
jgi:ABC-2 type transport system ATP-binding protein